MLQRAYLLQHGSKRQRTAQNNANNKVLASWPRAPKRNFNDVLVDIDLFRAIDAATKKRGKNAVMQFSRGLDAYDRSYLKWGSRY